MMGGVCFLLDGHMIGAAERAKSGERRFMFRVGKINEEAASRLPGARPLVQGGRRIKGFFHVRDRDCDDKSFSAWLSLALAFASALRTK